MHRKTILSLACLIACGCGRTDLDAATGGLASGGHIATGGASGGLASGGHIATGGAMPSGGFSSAGGTATSGGATSRNWSDVTSWRAGYVCPAEAPISQSPCECDELPCGCDYGSGSISIGDVCSLGRILCSFASGFELACFGGVWRLVGSGGGGTCYCGDSSVFYGTGGASSTGGTSANSTALQAGASSTGGRSANTLPIITSSGESHSCPTTEPYAQPIACACSNPPCGCHYTYVWTATSGCSDAHLCYQSLSFDYTCLDGVWQGSGTTSSGDCGCEIGDAGASDHAGIAWCFESRSTNTPSEIVIVYNDGSADRSVGPQPIPGNPDPLPMSYPPDSPEVQRFISDLTVVGDVSTIVSSSNCGKSASFGTTTTVAFAGKSSSDLQCIVNPTAAQAALLHDCYVLLGLAQ